MSTTVDFHFDPMCPFAYQTSLWIRDVREQLGITVNWRFFSLEEINRSEGKKHPWEREWSYGWSLMRIGALLRRTDMSLLDRWYAAIGRELHTLGGKAARSRGGATATERHRRRRGGFRCGAGRPDHPRRHSRRPSACHRRGRIRCADALPVGTVPVWTGAGGPADWSGCADAVERRYAAWPSCRTSTNFSGPRRRPIVDLIGRACVRTSMGAIGSASIAVKSSMSSASPTRDDVVSCLRGMLCERDADSDFDVAECDRGRARWGLRPISSCPLAW